jgi:hypothetical protein
MTLTGALEGAGAAGSAASAVEPDASVIVAARMPALSDATSAVRRRADNGI